MATSVTDKREVGLLTTTTQNQVKTPIEQLQNFINKNPDQFQHNLREFVLRETISFEMLENIVTNLKKAVDIEKLPDEEFEIYIEFDSCPVEKVLFQAAQELFDKTQKVQELAERLRVSLKISSKPGWFEFVQLPSSLSSVPDLEPRRIPVETKQKEPILVLDTNASKIKNPESSSTKQEEMDDALFDLEDDTPLQNGQSVEKMMNAVGEVDKIFSERVYSRVYQNSKSYNEFSKDYVTPGIEEAKTNSEALKNAIREVASEFYNIKEAKELSIDEIFNQVRAST